MMLDKRYYEMLEQSFNNNDTALEKILSSFQEEMLYDMTRHYIKNDKKELDSELKLFKRFQKLLSSYIKDFISYHIGIIIGIYKTIEFMSNTLLANRNFEKEMDAFYEKASVKEILVYLKEHPNAQHKKIAQELNIKTNRLSQIMKELEDKNCILRYGIDRRCFYELSLDGQAFLDKKIGGSGSCLYTEKLLDTTGLLDKFRVSDIIKCDAGTDMIKLDQPMEVLRQYYKLFDKNTSCKNIDRNNLQQLSFVGCKPEVNKVGQY